MDDVIEIETVVVDGPHGDVPGRLYTPAVGTGALLVWAHGGAFVFGDLDMPEADWVARTLASTGVTVLSVDYRKAGGGVHHPVLGDDVLAAWQWALERRDGIVGRSARVHLGGASAGANIVAGVGKRLRDGAGELPASLVLIYPLLHATLPPKSDELRRALEHAPPDAFMFEDDLIRNVARNYVGDEAHFDDPYAFPANGGLRGLPPVLIVNCEFDTLRASGEAFAGALEEAGVEVRAECEPGAADGHINEPASPAAARTLDRVVEWLTEH